MPQYNALLIDDESLAREVIENHLSKIGGFTIVGSCKNATEGFKVLSENKVDVIFLDINMPVLDGFSFLETL